MGRVEFEQMLLARHAFFVRARAVDQHLDRSAYVVLSRIELDGLMSIGELSEAFGLDVSTLNRQTTAMMKRGLVERVPDPDGGMARKFRMTEDGRERLAAYRSANVESLGRVMDDWSEADVEHFADLLLRFNRGIERLEGRDWPRP